MCHPSQRELAPPWLNPVNAVAKVQGPDVELLFFISSVQSSVLSFLDSYLYDK